MPDITPRTSHKPIPLIRLVDVILITSIAALGMFVLAAALGVL